MKIFQVDGKHFVRLGDVYHLLHTMVMEIMDKYDRDEDGDLIRENGKKGMRHDDEEAVDTLCMAITKIIKPLLTSCETKEEQNKVRDRLDDEFYFDKYVITTKWNDDDGKKRECLFRGWCYGAMQERLKQEGKKGLEVIREMEKSKGDPVFSELARDAECFETYEDAEGTAKYISHNYHIKVKVRPAWEYNPRTVERVLDAMFEDPGDGENEEKQEGGEEK